MGIIMRYFAVFAAAAALRVTDLGDLDLPRLDDRHDNNADKFLLAQKDKITKSQQKDGEPIQAMEKQLETSLRGANQGEMGRALASSKLESIKQTMSTLSQNFLGEGSAIRESMQKMLGKHMPSEMENDQLEMLSLKHDEVVSQIPRI